MSGKRSPLEEHAPDVTSQLMRSLSPEAMHALRAIAEMKDRSPEDVLRDEIRAYAASRLPIPDVESIIRTMSEQFYTLGYAAGTAKRLFRHWRSGR